MAALYGVFKNKWINPPKPVVKDYSGKCVIVTGSTSGIGEAAAYKFADLGASKVIITARDTQKGEETKARLEARLGKKGQLEVWELNMMSYDSCLAFARQASKLERLDIVVLNAGVWRSSYHRSEYGWEEDLQVNTLSTTLLALLLLPKLRQTKQQTGSTTILEFVNSGLHQSAVVPEEIRQEERVLAYYNAKDNFREGKIYSFSKVFLMYVTQRLAEEISSEDIIVTSICPGWVQTSLGRDRFFPGVFVIAFFFVLLFMRTPDQGANMVLSGTTQGESVHGRFWRHDQIQPLAPSLKGDAMKQLGSRVFEEIMQALEVDVPDVRKVLHAALARK